MPGASYDVQPRRKHKHRSSKTKTRTRHKSRRHKQREVSRVERLPGQSWFGTASLTLGLLALFMLAINGILLFQAHHGAPGTLRLFIEWVSRLELLTAVTGIILGLLSMPFSARGQRNAVLGVLAGFVVMGVWFYLANWRPLI